MEFDALASISIALFILGVIFSYIILSTIYDRKAKKNLEKLKKQRSPTQPPRYDNIYVDGIAWMNQSRINLKKRHKKGARHQLSKYL